MVQTSFVILIGPGCCAISPDTGFIRRPTIRRLIRAKMYATGKHGKCYIFVGIKYVEELLYNWVGT